MKKKPFGFYLQISSPIKSNSCFLSFLAEWHNQHNNTNIFFIKYTFHFFFFCNNFTFQEGNFLHSDRCNGNFHLGEEECLWIPATETRNRKIDKNKTQKEMAVFA